MSTRLNRTMTVLLLGLLLAACAAESEPEATAETASAPPAAPTAGLQPAPSPQRPTPNPQPTAPFRDLGPAPEIANEVWLNTDRPLPLASLRGQVVVVEFWTFG